MRQSKCKLPNTLITDSRLSFADRRVGLALFAFRNALGCCHKSYEELGRLACCSSETARKAVQFLSELGYIKYGNTYRYDVSKGVIFSKNEYRCELRLLDRGYTIVSRDVFSYELPHSTFIIVLSILMETGNSGRAFPSISFLQKITGAARSTVCAGLRLLKTLPLILIQLCRKRNGAYGASSYFPLRHIDATNCHPSSKETKRSTLSVFLEYITGKAKSLVKSACYFLQFCERRVVRFLGSYVWT